MANKSFLGLFGVGTKEIMNSSIIQLQTTMPTPTTTTTTTTPTPIIIHEFTDGNIEEIVTEIETVQKFLLIIVIQLSFVLLYKFIKMCRKGYAMHNQKIIRTHENSNPRL